MFYLVIIFAIFASYYVAYSYSSKNSAPIRLRLEFLAKSFFLISAVFAISITFFIIFSISLEAKNFFTHVGFFDFLFGTKWSPQTAIREDQAGSSGSFGSIAVFFGTFLITIIAMCVAIPIGVFAAIFLTEYASASLRSTLKPLIEILAGIPTIVYGFFALVTVAPILKSVGDFTKIDIAYDSALLAGLVMGIMIIPFVLSLTDDVLHSIPRGLKDASTAMGATKAETIRKIILPAARPGIIAAILLAVSRAIGETMIVVMAAGKMANLTINPFEPVTTATVQIVGLLTGEQSFDDPKTLAAFALSLNLFAITFMLNIIALVIVKKYQEKYKY